jgi:predicted DNA-binding protein
MEGISIKLPADLRRRLAAEARRRKMTQSAIVRESLEHVLGSPRGRKSPSSAELVRDLVGSIRSGQSDLATNKAHLERAMLESDRRAAKRRR